MALPLLAPRAAAAGDSPATDSEPADTVVVLGTRRTDVTALTSATPVDVISAAQIAQSGAANLSEAIQAFVPSFEYPQGSRSNVAGAAIRGVSLRGLGVDQTLVLIDGQRRYTSAALSFGSADTRNNGTTSVDLTAIPISAVERIEVLRDGAATKYGSDAIAGVVNIVLRQNTGSGDVSARVGQYADGQGLDRSVQGHGGIGLPGQGYLTIAADGWMSDAVSMQDLDHAQRYFAGDPREDTAERDNWFSGISPSKRYNVSVNGGLHLTDELLAHATVILGDKKDGRPQSLREAPDDGIGALNLSGWHAALCLALLEKRLRLGRAQAAERQPGQPRLQCPVRAEQGQKPAPQLGQCELRRGLPDGVLRRLRPEPGDGCHPGLGAHL